MVFYIATENPNYQHKLEQALEGLAIAHMSSEKELRDILNNSNIENHNICTNQLKVIFVDYEIYNNIAVVKKHKRQEFGTSILIVLSDNIDEVNIYQYPQPMLIAPLSRFSVSEIRTLIQLQISNMQKIEELHQDAFLDSLTKVKNRRAFLKDLDTVYNNYKQMGVEFCLAYLDLDHFKIINDTFGHAKGDEILEITAKLIVQSCRKTDIVGRIGGEEFGIIFPGVTVKQATEILDRLKTVIATTTEMDDATRVTFSGGLVAVNNYHNSYVEIIQDADLLLYKAKDWGRNQICQ